MTYQEKFLLITENSDFKAIADFFKERWGLGHKKYKTADDFMGDNPKVVSELDDFQDDLVVAVQIFNLPDYCSMMLLDYLTTGEIRENYPKIKIETEHDKWASDIGMVVLHISPDARLRDVKQIWHEVVSKQAKLHKGDIRTQKLRKGILAEKIIKPLIEGKDIDQIGLRESLFGEEQYNLPGPEFRKLSRKVNQVIRNNKSRYTKKLKPHLKLGSTKSH